jgi:dienelactone hydrolase
MGAALLWRVLQYADVEAAIVFYGIADLAHLEYLVHLHSLGKLPSIPIQCHFGTADPIGGFSDPETVKKLKKKIQEKNIKNIEIHEYEGMGHSFLAYDTEYYDENAASETAETVGVFLRKNQEQFDACLLF